MSKIKESTISRRSFVKSTSFFWLSKAIFTDPAIKTLADAVGLNTTPSSDFSCELFRSSDLLYLKYFFYNARVSGKHIRRIGNKPMYVYIKAPAQHIAEELVKQDPKTFTSRNDLRLKETFLSQSSWLAFKLTDEFRSLRFDPESLLDWKNNFDMLTIDSFASRESDRFSGYGFALQALKDEFTAQTIDDVPVLHSTASQASSHQPITTFDVPFRMSLSPIANPLTGNTQFTRTLGEHVFTENNLLKLHYLCTCKSRQEVKIVSPWENSLVFRTIDNELAPPRFKVVRAVCPQTADRGVELLPAPVNREELKELTMRKEYDRDVTADYFKIAALGATAYLKYKNDDPTLKFSIVGWQQKIKYARDNYVSVTFRAVDVFTGLKLLISIIAEREFKFGISFLPKKYYVAFAEKEKIYDDGVTVSKLPFKKIIPRTNGAYFYPQTFDLVSFANGTGRRADNSYLVARNKVDCVFDAAQSIYPENLVVFDYTGIDKNGAEHHFQSKIVFIPAEKYVIQSGTYQYHNEDSVLKDVVAGNPVPIIGIGELDPAQDVNLQPGTRPGCIPNPAAGYTYKLEKTFAQPLPAVPPGYSKLEILLGELKRIITLPPYRTSFAINIKNDLTYARLDGLKAVNLIGKDSTNATFRTSDILLAPEYNPNLSGPDFYLNNFPVVPALYNANVILSQIDQIQGRSEYRTVKYFNTYRNSNKDIDVPYDSNPALLFFELANGIGNFFTENYKSSGAVANPGIKITHVSALDNSISYNETHNDLRTGVTKNAVAGGFKVVGNVPGESVFRELKAEILGISLVSILQSSLGLNDLPVFAYARQFEQTLKRVEELEEEFKDIAKGWIAEYKSKIALIAEYKKQIEQYEEQLRLLSKIDLRAWLESVIEQSSALNYYRQQAQALQYAQVNLKAYVRDCLKPVKDKISAQILAAMVGGYDVATMVDCLITPVLTTSQQFQANLDNFIKKAGDLRTNVSNGKLPEKYLEEAVKIILIEKIINGTNALDLLSRYKECVKQAGRIEDKYKAAYQEIVDGINEALNFASAIGQDYQEQLENQVAEAISNMPALLEKLISDADLPFKPEQISGWLLKTYQLVQVYDNYHRLYANLRGGHYVILLKELGLDIPATYQLSIDKVQADLEASFKKEVRNLKYTVEPPTAIKTAFTELQNTLLATDVTLKAYEAKIDEINQLIQTTITNYQAVAGQLYRQYEIIVIQAAEIRAKLRDPEKFVADFVRNKIKDLQGDLDNYRRDIINKAKGSPEYLALQAKIAEYDVFIKKIQSLTRQKLDYKFNTKKFRKASLGGVIEFLPVPNVTELKINVNYEIELNITSLGKPPSIGRQSHVTESTLSNFKLGMLQLLYIDFERVRFITGSDVKDDFQVQIRNVEFAGFLGFFQAFQEYLKSLSDNLVFDISATGVRVGYGITIPDITSGAFNFFNLSLSALLTLPFQPEKSMQMQFGIGNELNKFGLTVLGIFGGQGYFNLIAEPRSGIVGMEVVLEFGAIFNLNLNVARGTAYLVGGIYIKRYKGNYELRGYILCVGRLNILGLFSASVTFYLALEGNSQVLKGVCRVTVSHQLTPFFEISVSFEMEKIIKGTESKGSTGEAAYLKTSTINQTGDLYIADTNLNKAYFYHDEEIYIYIKTDDTVPVAPKATLVDNNSRALISSVKSKSQGSLHYFSIRPSDMPTGEYELNIAQPGTANLVKKVFKIVSAEADSCSEELNTYISLEDYYASYYHSI
ncbi:hypothetical protein LT679_09230 [Mucilaginibacter roseus]|uniref:Uncharacterized protein n=1 Tax=Mucilaginibacter roseus TaxID=1528868 RepID=A0ABS8U3V0_9SPHI|nr:hypothetical protein [Mucilaginibacter roseus]MCD8740780.1 hypothetical protein [Mucilaginibacter roseus]